ncbi:ATP-binding protein [Enterobacter sp. I4]|uniref:ATP-binding protein n=1 Tax=Enterobacter TaxID=547 RepID=UPI001F589C6F|nr:ATP-binding protein [Enterobacter sp. I4]MCI2294126.1 ATP-binding protein [Enterobacter sp. I4]
MTQLRVRARAVDMLGRQQIAGIPTAIHELFKNAHDAYAERVEVDYFRRNQVLILRDDGYGMTRDDVESRWLTLGTESRVDANEELTDKEWRGPKTLARRSIMGEKGIGRLAIAVIAPITLLMTRATRPEGLHNLVVTLIHWGLFEQPGIDVSQINIPIAEFSVGNLPTREDIRKLAEEIEKNIEILKKDISRDSYFKLLDDLQKVKILSPDIIDSNLNQDKDNPLTLSGDGYGTHFIVLPVAPELEDDIDGGTDKESSKLERNLLGFSNLMAMDNPVIKTEFRDHGKDGILERIGSSSFFSNEDFNKTDQYFEGDFDEYGQFVGIVSIYGKPREFVCNWPEGKGRRTRCGAFSLRYGYVQGRSNESRLAPEDWSEITSKTERVGGLYIYRDGIRILPYGNSDVDWLDIEKRRTLAAKDWYFSYRRGFGYVAIKHNENKSLTEKAGREGFRENQAYRDFRGILVNFFRQLAYEFFRVSSPQGEDFNESKSLFIAQAELLKKQQERANHRRRKFQEEIDGFFADYNKSFFDEEITRIKEYLQIRLHNISSIDNLGELSSEIKNLESEIKQQLNNLENKAELSIPRGLSLNSRIKKDLAVYEQIKKQLKENLFTPLRADFENQIQRITRGKIEDSELRDIALKEIEKEKEAAFKEISILKKDTTAALENMQASVKSMLKDEFSKIRYDIEFLINDFSKKTANDPRLLDVSRYDVERKINELRMREASLLDSFKRQLIELAEDVKERETLDDRFAALESENEVLKEQIEFYSEFAQMGMSVGILQHEFESAARGIKSAMLDLKPWSDKNPQLSGIYKQLRNHIDHLDGYLKVLDPLGRRMNRITIDISGDEILNVIRHVFNEILETSAITLIISLEFRRFKLSCKSSALIGAFINVIDNAIYWLNSRAQGKKEIYLGADENGFLISNNGPGIEFRNSIRIFDFGETTKPGGRGMGLAITKQVLNREGLEIKLINFGLNESPIFKISPKENNDE